MKQEHARGPKAPAPHHKTAQFPYRRQKDIFSFHNAGLPAASAIVAETGKLAYVPIPKNACSSLKLWFYQLIHGVEFSGKFIHIHGKFPYRAIHFDKFFADTDHFKFVVVRDPLDRFVSAYNNRVADHKELSKAWFGAIHPNPAKVFAIFEQKSLTFDPDINEFASRLEDYMDISSNIRHHFLPQYQFINSTPEAFDRIYNIRQMDQLRHDLSIRINRPVQFPRVQEGKTTGKAARLSDLGVAELAKLNYTYREDFRLLGPYL